ncbi:hypothetical protein L249_0828 [Ophiocordyceps polyrhachis-furcata BCC 54312]|uniref:Uncharacterized protein n=1 Tax=Ophiocordyceps polyrhachis-furcata BCC 54312 TaxID=1330021 RepID=A0A367LFQ9_9HYPO|nr:hypothetical protein L249_0828 [Ophiocordyceps polyrhachis-furcata BCC 54312]
MTATTTSPRRHPPNEKLPPIRDGAKVRKRPLLRRQVGSSSKKPVIYVSSSTPFMSVVNRVQKLLDKSLRDASAATAAPRNASLSARVKALGQDDAAASASRTTVTISGAGKAIEKTLSVAGWFENKGDCVVEVRSGTVGAIDDVLPAEGEDGDDETRVRRLSYLEVVVRLK